MPKATNQQVQQFVDGRIRPRAEQLRAAILSVDDDISQIADVYAALNTNPSWLDNRQDVPHDLTPSDVLAINAFYAVVSALKNDPSWAIVRSACVQPVSQGF